MRKSQIKKIIEGLKEKNAHIVTAESLTCGMIASSLANISGASAVVNGGFCVYQDEMKSALLGVPADMLKQFSAVSEPVARAMAAGALDKTGFAVLGDKASQLSVAVTGYAGSPGGAAPESDAGLVFIGIGQKFNRAAAPDVTVYRHVFKGDRAAIRKQTTDQALKYVLELIR